MEQGWYKWIISQENILGVEKGKNEREAEPQSMSSPSLLSRRLSLGIGAE